MLVLSRKIGQRIRIGDQIEIVIADVRGDRVRVGIVAPPEVPVHREELYERLQADEASAYGASEAELVYA